MMNNLLIVKSLYDAFRSKDELQLRRLLAVDVLWIQCAGFPGGGVQCGVDEVLDKVLAGLYGQWQSFRVEDEEYLDAGASIVVLGHYTGTHTTTCRSMEAAFAHVYDVQGGLITRFRQIADTVPIAEAAGSN